MKNVFLILPVIVLCFLFNNAYAQKKKKSNHLKSHKKETTRKESTIKYGMASYYAKKFHGRKTATGNIHRDELYTAACNVLPLNSWVKVTNLKNNKSVIAKINDRMHPKNKRLIDLSQSAAKQLGYVHRGVTKVKVELLPNYHARRKN